MTINRFRTLILAVLLGASGACADNPTDPTISGLAPSIERASSSPLGGIVTLSQITFESRYFPGGSPGSTAAAITAFGNASTTTPGYSNAPIVIPTLDNISNHGLVSGGVNSSIAYRVRVSVVSTGTSVAAFRFGADFGKGGTLLLDGVEVQSRWTDMWWGGSFSNPTQYLTGTLTLSPGAHLIELYGFEGCCDGAMKGELDVGNGGETIEVGTFEPDDSTPPVIGFDVLGTQGENGWYISDATVSWTVSDADSPSSLLTEGCAQVTVTDDTAGVVSSCSASSDGGSAGPITVTVKRDATAPSIAFSGATSYTVDQTVSIGCAASDAMSGVASVSCPSASGAASSFPIGVNTLSASAEDNAGNTATASRSFTVSVTGGSLCELTTRFVSQAGIAKAMCKQLENRAYGAYQNHVRAQSGKTVSQANAALLIDLAGKL